MVSDQEIARGVESVLRQSDANAVTSLNGVVQQLEHNLGLDLSHKSAFIRDHITLLLRSSPQQLPPPKDHFALHNHPIFHNATPPHHFALLHHPPVELSPRNHLPPPPLIPPQQSVSGGAFVQKTAAAALVGISKESAPAGTKRRAGTGGLNKLCGVSPELQAIVGEPQMPRTQIVKQLWAYIRTNNLQDPSNKRTIICNDALRLLFETDSTDMFQMNKLLAKHIFALEPKNESGQAKRPKLDVEAATENSEPSQSPVILSEALTKFFGTGESEMFHSEALRRIWEYIKVNRLEDPVNAMMILCDHKLGELLGRPIILALEIPDMLAQHHFFKRS